jgi:hypothetical protein
MATGLKVESTNGKTLQAYSMLSTVDDIGPWWVGIVRAANNKEIHRTNELRDRAAAMVAACEWARVCRLTELA